MTVIATVEDLCINFFDRPVLSHVNVILPAKGISVIVGRSGSGKSTFLRAFNRLNNEFEGCTTEGQITLRINGQAIPIYQDSPLSDAALRLQTGMLFQTPNVLPVSIWRNLALPLELHFRLNKVQLAERIEHCLTSVGLWQELADRLHHPAIQLSGGQQQRLCLARALALQPQILLLDEPTASLDIVASQQIEQLLIDLSKQYAVIMVSHNLAQAQRLAQRLLVFEQGRLIEYVQQPAEISEQAIYSLLMHI